MSGNPILQLAAGMIGGALRLNALFDPAIWVRPLSFVREIGH